MMKMFRACGIECSQVTTSYEGEVLMGVAKIDPKKPCGLTVDQVLEDFKIMGNDELPAIREFITKRRCALWGGSGKSAMFISKLDLPDNTLVVDSHDVKWDFYVPGTQIRIFSPDVLLEPIVDHIIVTTSWRALDIRDEIKRRKLHCGQLLKFEHGRLEEVPLGE